MPTRSHVRALLSLALPALLATAGGAAAAGDDELRRAFFEPVEVPLVSVDVYVTDGDGRPVPGLTLDDFVVLEDGAPVTPTHFYAAPGARPAEHAPAEDAEAPPVEAAAPLDQLLLAVWIDDTGLDARRRRNALEHLEGFLAEQLPAHVQVALVRYDGGVHIRQTFTADRDRIAAALAEVQAEGASVSRLAEERMLIQRIRNASSSTAVMGSGGLEAQTSELQAEVESYAAEAFQRARHAFASLAGFVDTLGVLPGQKLVLVISDAVNPRPGERVMAELQQALGRSPGEARAASLGFGRRYDLGRDLRTLLEKANGSRVTFTTLSAMAERSLGLGSAENRGGSPADLDQIMVEEQALLTMAGVTGGKVLENSGTLPRQLEQVAAEAASYYSIGYPPPTPEADGYRRLEVRVRRDGVRVRHREGYLRTASGDDLIERTIAAATLGVTVNPLGVAVELRPTSPREDDTFLVPVLVQLPIGQLVLAPGHDTHEGRISLVVVVRAEDGGLSEPERREYPIVVPNRDLVRATASNAGYTLGLVVAPGRQRIAVGVRDDLADVAATAVAEVEVGAAE